MLESSDSSGNRIVCKKSTRNAVGAIQKSVSAKARPLAARRLSPKLTNRLPLKTCFLQSLGFKRSLVACSSSSPPRGIQGDNSRPIRATIAFDFYDFYDEKKLSCPQIFLGIGFLMFLNAFKYNNAENGHKTRFIYP